ncbi:MAG: YdeI/OmpD-associated family protein [Thermoleophilia bacterium]|nr:YdeI/OmpD-associated family protein [Thermoleophilia bacterium]
MKPSSATPSAGGTYIEFPFDVEEMFGTAGRIPVRLTLRGPAGEAPYRGSLVKYRGVMMVGITKAVRERAGAAVGDRVHVSLELDRGERTVDLPPDLAEALARDETAAAGWDRFSYTHQREYVQSIVEAKRNETRVKRVAAAVAAAREKGAGTKT